MLLCMGEHLFGIETKMTSENYMYWNKSNHGSWHLWFEHFTAQNKYLFPTGELGNSQTWLCWVVNPAEKAVCLKLCHHTQISDSGLNLPDHTFSKITLPASLQQRLDSDGSMPLAPPPLTLLHNEKTQLCWAENFAFHRFWYVVFLFSLKVNIFSTLPWGLLFDPSIL